MLLSAVTGAPAAPVPEHRTTRDARLPRHDRDVPAVPVGRSPLSERATRFRVTSMYRPGAKPLRGASGKRLSTRW